MLDFGEFHSEAQARNEDEVKVHRYLVDSLKTEIRVHHYGDQKGQNLQDTNLQVEKFVGIFISLGSLVLILDKF